MSATAAPDIYIGTVYDYLDGAQSSYRKRISNSGDSTAFVRVDLYEITYGADGPQETPLHSAPDGPRRLRGSAPLAGVTPGVSTGIGSHCAT